MSQVKGKALKISYAILYDPRSVCVCVCVCVLGNRRNSSAQGLACTASLCGLITKQDLRLHCSWELAPFWGSEDPPLFSGMFPHPHPT